MRHRRFAMQHWTDPIDSSEPGTTKTTKGALPKAARADPKPPAELLLLLLLTRSVPVTVIGVANGGGVAPHTTRV